MAKTQSERQVAWGWVAGCEFPGACLIGLAFFLQDRYKWQGDSEATLIAIGTALLLAGVLFFFERRFLRDVGEIAAREGAAAAQAEVAEATEDINVRIDQLAERMREGLAEQAAAHDAAVVAMETPTFDTVGAALALANSLGALKFGHVTVPASDDPDELGLEFSWGEDRGDGRFGHPARNVLKVEALVYADFHISGGRPVIEIEWGPSESATEAGLRLHAQLTARGRLRSEATFRWEQALQNLRYAIDIAVRSRRRDPGALHLHGALAELVNDDWVITEAGLECPNHEGYIYAQDNFPSRLERMARLSHKEREEWIPDRPEWVDEALWRRLIDRGKRMFPIERGGPRLTNPPWLPATKTPADLRRMVDEGHGR